MKVSRNISKPSVTYPRRNFQRDAIAPHPIVKFRMVYNSWRSQKQDSVKNVAIYGKRYRSGLINKTYVMIMIP